ncbi:MAG: DinB family protein [Leptospiraceae bacterium]|nr:DinB family protein [Leptospiraceae bacterium]
MRPLPEVHSTSTIPELVDQSDQIFQEVAAFIREIPLESLNVSGYPEGWSAAKNVRHVANTMSFLSSYLGAPSWLHKLRGQSKSKMPAIEEVRPTNRPPRYDYGTYNAGKPAPEALREELINKLQRAIEKFKKALQRRTEEEMDQRKGAFGGMNLRLFSEFMLKHTVFHLSVVRARILAARNEKVEVG